MENSYKRIVCDIDDTISITTNRDWENAKPIQEVINKINEFYDLGWEIYLCTARGYLSCNGDRTAADLKYREQIETWLHDNNVKYHVLSFQKVLAQYYIDDKCLTPQQFVDMQIKEIKSGWSRSHIELRDNKVYKTHPNSLSACQWYETAKSFFNVPIIHSLIGETICMEYIENDEQIKMNDVIDVLKNMSCIPSTTHSINFDTYITRIKNHNIDANNIFDDVINSLTIDETVKIMNNNKSFCHGDFSYDNILHNNGKLYLIDPIFDPNLYSSWLLDLSKLLFSLFYKRKITEYKYVYTKVFKTMFDDRSTYHLVQVQNTIARLIASQGVRVYKYAPEIEKPKILTIINEFINEYK